MGNLTAFLPLLSLRPFARHPSKENAEVVVLAAQIEADINELETFEERQMFLEELGLEEPGVNRLIRKAYETRSSKS